MTRSDINLLNRWVTLTMLAASWPVAAAFERRRNETQTARDHHRDPPPPARRIAPVVDVPAGLGGPDPVSPRIQKP